MPSWLKFISTCLQDAGLDRRVALIAGAAINVRTDVKGIVDSTEAVLYFISRLYTRT